MMKKWFTLALILSCTVFFLAGCMGEAAKTDPSEQTADPTESIDPSDDDPNTEQSVTDHADLPEQPYTTEATLVAVGDIMVHYPQIVSAYSVTTATYSFDDNFEEVSPILKSGDWVIGNLETTLAGSNYPYTGYPQFNSPDELADALVNAGFNILGTANNHSYDRREAGLLRTLEILKEKNIVSVGTHASPEERDDVTIVTKHNIDMALLAYTYGTNGIPLPPDKPYLVNLIDEEQMRADIEQARIAGADVITVMLHFGNEYARQPNDAQKRLAKQLITWGADIILGSHTHVLQPYEWIETEDDSGQSRRGLVVYSMGNFISNQGPEHDLPIYTDVGVIFKVQIKKHFPEEKIELGVVESIPTWVHKYRDASKRHYRILPLEEVVRDQDDKWLTDRDYKMLNAYLEEMTAHLRSMAVPVSD